MFIVKHTLWKAFHVGSNSSCCQHIRSHYELYKACCAKQNIPVKSRSTPVRGPVKSGRKRTKEKGRGLDKGLVRPELRPIGFNDKGVER